MDLIQKMASYQAQNEHISNKSLQNWNNPINFNYSTSFIDQFRNQVKSTPKNYAICEKELFITYQQLDEESDKLAAFLQSTNLKKGDYISVCLPNGAQWITTLLGILKMGGVYCPIDPNFPADRIDQMLKTTNPKVVITSNEFAPIFDNSNKNIIKIEEHQNEISIQAQPECVNINPQDEAYIIYTSGSTGAPKGIVITHRSLPNISLSRKEYYPSHFKALLSGGVCFDASLLVIFYSLANGGCLFIPNFKLDKNLSDLRLFVKTNKINFMICVPSLYFSFLETQERFDALLCVSLTGEPISRSLTILHKKCASDAVLLNEYGPSECAIGTTIGIVYCPKTGLNPPYIGKPLDNTQVYIVDKNRKLVPPNTIGEICIAGVGLTKGYLNNNSTRENKFNNISIEPSLKARVYMTGDMGCYSDNGEIQYLGREEQTVYLNKQKIHLGMIESVFYEHPNIKNIVVFVIPSKERNKIMACFTQLGDISLDDLYDFLEKKLPSHMVPSKIVKYFKFPTTPNGKVNTELVINKHIKNNLTTASKA
ncbi:MAG: amino acid adenylation domain-containing protein [Rhabdochlamydiaceae bacterium]|nr:amino acid adenylation domain-containing protein [Candidatus Amphrikana amoebophyrae]